MPEELLVTSVLSQTIGVNGRCLNSARTNHFVIDEPKFNGGPGEELTPAEAFLAGISGCAVLLIESWARQDRLPLRKAEGRIEGVRTASNPADFTQVNFRIQLTGVDQKQAEALVERYKGR